jgi:hypothetical protein
MELGRWETRRRAGAFSGEPAKAQVAISYQAGACVFLAWISAPLDGLFVPVPIWRKSKNTLLVLAPFYSRKGAWICQNSS